MAYMDFAADPLLAPPTFAPRADPGVEGRLSALEWSVVALARYDRISSLARPGRLAVALGKVFGTRPQSLHLADPKLEALRRMAVLYWRQGRAVADPERAAFHRAGFSHRQYRTMTASIDGARTPDAARA